MQDVNTDPVTKANAFAAEDIVTYGDPTSFISKQRIMTDAILKISGCDRGAPVTPQVVAALEAGAAIVGLLNAPMPADALARFIAAGINAAPIIQLVERATLGEMARRAAAAGAPPAKDDDAEQPAGDQPAAGAEG